MARPRRPVADALAYAPIALLTGFTRLLPWHARLGLGAWIGRVAVTRIPKCTAADLDMAVDAARRAFDDRRWSGLNGQARAAVLLRAGALIRERAEEMAQSAERLLDILPDVPGSGSAAAPNRDAATSGFGGAAGSLGADQAAAAVQSFRIDDCECAFTF